MHAEEIVCAGFWVSTEGFAPSEDEGNYLNSFEGALSKLITNAQYPSVLRTPRRKYHDHSYFIGKEGPKKWRNMSKVIQSQARFGLDNPVGAHVSPKMLQHIEMDIQPHDSPDSWALLSVPLSSAFLSQMSQSSPYSQSQPYSQGCPTCHTGSTATVRATDKGLWEWVRLPKGHLLQIMLPLLYSLFFFNKSSIFRFLFIVCVRVFCLHVWMWMPGAHKGQMRVLVPGTGAMGAVGHLGTGNWDPILCKEDRS